MDDNLEPLFEDPALKIEIKKSFNKIDKDEDRWRHELYMNQEIKKYERTRNNR
jgi:hypothetical protein